MMKIVSLKIQLLNSKVLALFPSSQGLEVTWSSVVKIAQSLYREGPGKDPFRPDQRTPVKNFFLAGSYTKQDYIDSMEGTTLSGRQASAYVCGAGEELVALRKTLAAVESQDGTKSQNLIDELSLVFMLYLFDVLSSALVGFEHASLKLSDI
ncbi:hypothetical protein NC653_030676 [Populus alba x Populus x berolinensis]|nr:hypothetical protein NC653_030676 [Populus alba x Populus x berolinensis]